MNRIKRERMIRQGTLGTALLKGTAWSLGITILGAAVMASLILKGTLQDTAIGYAAMAILLLASFAGSMITVRRVGKKLVVSAMMSSAIYFGILSLLNAIVYKGGYEGVGVTALVIAAGAGVTVLLNVNSRGGKRAIRA